MNSLFMSAFVQILFSENNEIETVDVRNIGATACWNTR